MFQVTVHDPGASYQVSVDQVKNWIHIGSQQAGPKVAAILSIVESCRRLKIPIRDYLSAVLPGLANLPIYCIKERTPSVWAASNL
jgi:hypothetical protein